MPTPPTVGIIGGTGAHGRGLALRLAVAGHRVLLGSRDRTRARSAVADVVARAAGVPGRRPDLVPGTNATAAAAGEVVLLALPWDHEAELVTGLAPALAGKVVISCANPLAFDRTGPHQAATSHPSAAERTAALLPGARVVGAFHHLSAQNLLDPAAELSGEDVLVCGDEPEAKAVVQRLCRSVTGRPGVDAGPLRLARQIEPFTAVLISVNRRYGVRTGINLSHVGTHEPPVLARPA